MEKIQAANAKARAARAEAGGPPPAPPPAAVPAPAARPELWAAIPAFEPDPARLAQNRIVAAGGGSAAVPFDVLRTKVVHQARANGWKSLGITSPTPGCGKSTISLNLAYSLARQPGFRVMLLEADLRRPTLARILGFPGPASVARVLRGDSPLAAQAVRLRDSLILAITTAPVRDAADLIHDPRVPRVLAAIAADYAPDLMLFDMPPVLAGDDALAFADHIDCALIVAATEATTVKQIDLTERELAARTNVMGVVLNKARQGADDYGYGYGTAPPG